MIEVKNLSKSYAGESGTNTVFSGVSCHISKGDVIGIVGPSGSGKSTLMHCLDGLETASSGEIWFNGINICDPATDIAGIRKSVGVVFQNFELFNHLTVLENITLAPMKLNGLSRQQADEKAMEVLRTVGLAQCTSKYPDELSGGQKQRVAIARCLAMDPQILFMDEPTSALDAARKKEVAGVINNLAQEGMTMIIATNEHKLVQRVCNKVMFMCEGSLYEQGSLDEVFNHPKRPKTKEYVHNIFGLRYHIEGTDFDLYNLNSELEMYCQTNGMAEYTGSVQLICEEMLTSVMSPGPRSVMLKSGMDSKPSLTFVQENCNTPVMDREGADELSLMLIGAKCKDIKEKQDGDNRSIKMSIL